MIDYIIELLYNIEMKTIKYIKGDATSPIGEGNKIIIHCCNSVGAWGAGFVLALSKKWKEPEVQYRKWFRGYDGSKVFELGQVQFVKVEGDIIVANMIGQEGVGFNNGMPPIRYNAIDKCLKQVAEIAKKYNASIHGPRFGSALAGGKWEEIEKLIIENLCENDISVTIYDFN